MQINEAVIVGDEYPPLPCCKQQLLIIPRMAAMQIARRNHVMPEGTKFVCYRQGDIVIKIEMRHKRLCSGEQVSGFRRVGGDPIVNDRTMPPVERDGCLDGLKRQGIVGCHPCYITLSRLEVPNERPDGNAGTFDRHFSKPTAMWARFEVLPDPFVVAHSGTCLDYQDMCPLSVPPESSGCLQPQPGARRWLVSRTVIP